tara:strand:+ start:919 stop:1056 length:138 start_codon:yes stop_codon:yes gene_type:complete
MELKYKKALIEMNKQFNKSGIKFEDASAGWERYKRKVKEQTDGTR